jgi:hypothetical protein
VLDDPKWELAILATVQGFYEKLLQESVGGEVPVPAGLETVSLQDSDGEVQGTLSRMHRWLRLLDLAISPAMLRRALTPDTDPEIAEAILRYFARKKDISDANRDKTDLVATFLYRHPRVPGQWERRGYGLDGSLPLSPFEIALIEILSETEAPLLSDDHVQTLRQFDRLQEDAMGMRDLHALLESGIVVRVRELKQSFGPSFFHPGVLATLAPYNTAFGRKFDELFLRSAADIKRFAAALEEQGGSILGNVDGVDVTVEHVAALQENELLRIDYSSALEKFRRISRLKKTLDQHPPIRLTMKLAPPGRMQSAKTQTPSPRTILDLQAMRSAVTPQQLSAEEGKMLRIEESIRVFVRVADPRFRKVVPMRYFNLILTDAEADAYCADYLEEKSLRCSVARSLLRLVAVSARLTTELEELKRARNSDSLWKLHADSLAALLETSRPIRENAEHVLELVKQDGNEEQVKAVEESMRKLESCIETVTHTLTNPPESKMVGAGTGK